MSSFQGPSGVLTTLLFEIALGSLGVLALAPVWGVVKRGFFLLVGWTAAVCALLALVAAPALEPGLAPFAVMSVLAVLLVQRRERRARAAVAVATVAGAVTAAGIGGERPAGQVSGTVAVLAGAVLVGATWNAMVLGHWYLVDRKLPVAPMRWHAWAYTAGVALGLVSAAFAKGGAPSQSEASLNPLLYVSNLTLWLAFGLVAVCALLAFFVHKLVNEGSIRAATGMLYLAVIMALSAEFAAKARFFTV